MEEVPGDKKSYFEKYSQQLTHHAHRAASAPLIVEDDRTGMSEEAFKRAVLDNLFYLQGTSLERATLKDYYMALSYTVRDRLIYRWLRSLEAIQEQDAKAVCYLSAEFLMGRQLGNNLLNIGCFQQARRALDANQISIYDVLEQEPEPGLGNGGLGRLAACFLDSLSTLDIPAVGYGIRYEYGIFRQSIENGWQIEHPDKWLTWGNPWEIARPQHTVTVGFGGQTEWGKGPNGELKIKWVPDRTVVGTPYDTMVPGHGTNMVNTLRLWSSGTSNDFDFKIFNDGDYNRAVAEKTSSENISKVLYPNDWTPQGRELRLKQQYFFVSCSLQDIIHIYLSRGNRSLENLSNKFAIQLNDTHPAVAVPELMRLLVDEHDLTWEKAWETTVKVCGYTNHTLMGEALERWHVSLFQALLPRHMEIINEINRRFLSEIAVRFPNDPGKLSRMSIIEEGGEKRVRMANLATVGSHAVNGVAALHSELVKKDLLPDFYQMWPEKFGNKTNGVTPRRWMMLSNPKLTYLITERIGKGWIKDLSELKKLEPLAEDPGFREVWKVFKLENKSDLAEYIQQANGVTVNPQALFDVQVKRLHEYKRQLLSVLHIITLYHRIKENPSLDIVPRVFIFGAKAAPGYYNAKLIIKLINSVGDVINNDPDVRDRLKVVFLANFCVSLGERIYPAADLSEQISTAGTEASGTGNMKFTLNGALTIGTLDGANVEIRDAVGPENFFLFGHTVETLNALKMQGYNPMAYYEANPMLKKVVDSIATGMFSAGDKDLFTLLVDGMLGRDTYFLMADYQAYIDCQDEVSKLFMDEDEWSRRAILNVARAGFFSSDRTIREYCRDIWDAKPVSVKITAKQQAQHLGRKPVRRA